jgi:hypothetical protein
MYFVIARQPLGHVAAPSSSHLGLRPSFMVIDSHLPSASFIVTHRNYLVTTNDSVFPYALCSMSNDSNA